MKALQEEEAAGVAMPTDRLPTTCYRNHIGCTYEEHERYLHALGLEPEVRADGTWVGLDNAAPPADPDALDPALLKWIGVAPTASLTRMRGR